MAPRMIEGPTRIPCVGTRPKLIDEYVGNVTTDTASVSIAHMRSPGGWEEPGQTPEFDEYTVVLKGMLRVEYKGGALEVGAGQAVHVAPGEWIRYSTPTEEGAEYMAICLPAFRLDTVHRDE